MKELKEAIFSMKNKNALDHKKEPATGPTAWRIQRLLEEGYFSLSLEDCKVQGDQ